MTHKSTLAVWAVIALLTVPLVAQQAPPARVSPHETISTVIGPRQTGNRITITYGRPYAKNPRGADVRKVWGALVPWDQPWRMGADEATTLLTQYPLVIGGTTIPAGAYTLYFIPSESGTSKLAFSKKLGGWGIPVDVNQDQARVDVRKDAPLATAVDQFTIAVEADAATGGGVIKWMWENTQFSVPFTVQR